MLGILGDLLLGWLWWLVPEEVDRRRDLKRLLDGEVRCSMRAIDRRVLNIGTNWSGGIAHIERGMLRFSPSVGIVGDRMVPVHSIRRAPTPNALAGDVAGVGFIITTNGGELMVRFPTVVAEEVTALLADTTADPDETSA